MNLRRSHSALVRARGLALAIPALALSPVATASPCQSDTPVQGACLMSPIEQPAKTLSRGSARTVSFAPAAEQPARATADVPVRYWRLPTGSRIAYACVPSSGPVKRAPVIFVHGGPGACEVFAYTFAHSWYERLAAAGFDVYLYDQIGSGDSARLADPREYTLSRHVADLEAIRQEIGCEQMILVGESHGATLTASYIAAHPGRVERAIFVSPGPIEPAAAPSSRGSPTPALPDDFLQWVVETRDTRTVQRCQTLQTLLGRDVTAAHAFAGDAEMDELMSAWVRERILIECVHDTTRLQQRGFSIPHMGWWSYLMTNHDEMAHNRSVRAQVAKCSLPVLILRGDSDNLPFAAAAGYVEAFSNASLIRVPEAGHFLWMDKPERYHDELESFLRKPQAPPLARPARL